MKLRPLGDRVILKYQEAMVVVVGSGMSCEGKNIQMQVKEGDRREQAG